MIEQAPLQLYCSALVFAPEKSIVLRQFEKCIPDWNAALQTLEGYSRKVTSVAFSIDSKLLVSGLGVKMATLYTSSDSLEQLDGLFVLKDWVVEGSENILWLPPDYRATCVAVWNRTVVLGHSLGDNSFLEFKQGPKLR